MPDVGAAVGHLGEQAPRHQIEHVAALDEQRRGLHQVAEHAELDLRARPVATAHRPAVAVAGQVQRLLLRGQRAVEAIHRAQPRPVAADRGRQPGERRLGLLGGADAQERLDGVGDVAHPGVAVVVVLVAADALGQRRRGRSGDRPGGREQQQLERQGAAPDLGGVQAVHLEVAAPLPPRPVGAVDARVDLGQRRQDQRLVGRGQQRQRRTRPRPGDEPRLDTAIVLHPPHHAVVGAERRDHAVDVQHVAVRARLAPRTGLVQPASRSQHDGERDAALQTLHALRQFAPRQAPGDAAVQRAGHPGAAGDGGEHLLQNVAVGAVTPLHGEGGLRRHREPPAGLRVEQPVEQRLAVHVRHAPPVDRAVGTDQRHAAPVAERRILPERQGTGDAPRFLGHGRWLPPVTP